MFKITNKVWGTETELVNNELYCSKYLDIDIGGCSSLHYHKRKHETFVVIGEPCMIEAGPLQGRSLEVRTLIKGDKVELSPFTVHRFWVPKDWKHECRLLEVSTTHDEDDVFRLEESKRL